MALSIAMIPLAADARISGKAIRADFHENWPDLPKPVKSDGGEENTIGFAVGDDIVLLGVMPAPIPWGDLEGPCETSWLWPEARKVLRKHTDHIIVTVTGDEDPIARAKLLTMVCASVLATCEEALGVYWGDAALVNSSKIFQAFTNDSLGDDGLPLYLWIDFRAGLAEDGRTAGFTVGLKALGHREFETESSTDEPGDLRERFFALANYVLDNGPVIKDGNTVGGDENEKIRVVLADSAFGNPKRVLRLEYESVKKKKKRRD